MSTILEDAMRVIDTDWGETLQAANEDDLRKVLAEHAREQGVELSDDEIEELVASRSYDASDS